MARVIGGLGLLLVACTTSVPFAQPRDAAVDAPFDPWSAIPQHTIQAGGSDAGGRTDAGPGAACSARLLVLFDRSLSMQMEWTGGGASGPRWQIAEMALASAVMPHASQLTVGALLFPSASAMPMGGVCDPVDPIDRQIPFQPCTAFLSTWTATWSAPTLLGSTPIDSAFDAAEAALSGAGAETAVVLLTDGEPTCSGAVSAQTRAASWRTRGISTWVVGLPGSEAGATYLAGIAAAGGTSPVSVTDPSALGTALTGIAGTHVQGQCGH